MQIKTMVKYHLVSVRMATIKKIKTTAGKIREKRRPLYTVGGIVNYYSHYGNQYEVYSKN